MIDRDLLQQCFLFAMPQSENIIFPFTFITSAAYHSLPPLLFVPSASFLQNWTWYFPNHILFLQYPAKTKYIEIVRSYSTN